MSFSVELLIAIVSAIVAFLSAVFAWQATKTAEKTYSVELIGQLYTTYQSDRMLNDLKTVWVIYKKIWVLDSDNLKEIGDKKASSGMQIRIESALNYYKNLVKNGPEEELVAIHNIIIFWTYLELLLKQNAVTPQVIKSFTSPRLLGFLSPMAKVYEIIYEGKYDKDTCLVYSYNLFNSDVK